MSSVVIMVIAAAVAAVVLFQLYNVLGRRVGRQPQEGDLRITPVPEAGPRRKASDPVLDGPAAPALSALKAKDPAFDLPKFLSAAKSAYETIVKAYALGDRDALKPLLGPDVSASFEAGMESRQAAGRTETIEFLHPPRADLDGADVAEDVARLKVRFLAELRSRSKGPEGEAVEDRRTAELWTFERPMGPKGVDWRLSRVEAAEA